MKINRLLLLLGFAISFSTVKAQMTVEELNEAINLFLASEKNKNCVFDKTLTSRIFLKNKVTKNRIIP
jgi:hypothetical protein